MNFGSLFRAFGPRVIGTVVSFLAGWIFTKTKGAVVLDPTQITELGTTMLLTYGIAHTATAATLNPAGVASPALVPSSLAQKDKVTNTPVTSIGGKS